MKQFAIKLFICSAILFGAADAFGNTGDRSDCVASTKALEASEHHVACTSGSSCPPEYQTLIEKIYADCGEIEDWSPPTESFDMAMFLKLSVTSVVSGIVDSNMRSDLPSGVVEKGAGTFVANGAMEVTDEGNCNTLCYSHDRGYKQSFTVHRDKLIELGLQTDVKAQAASFVFGGEWAKDKVEGAVNDMSDQKIATTACDQVSTQIQESLQGVVSLGASFLSITCTTGTEHVIWSNVEGPKVKAHVEQCLCSSAFLLQGSPAAMVLSLLLTALLGGSGFI